MKKNINEIEVTRFTPYTKEEAENNRKAIMRSCNPSYENFMKWRREQLSKGVPSVQASFANYQKAMNGLSENKKYSTIRLTESDLHRLIKESVNEILSELDWRTYANAVRKAKEKAEKAPDIYEKKRRSNQASSFRKASDEAYSKQYNLKDYDDLKYRNIKKEPSQGELKRLSQRTKDSAVFNGWYDDEKAEYNKNTHKWNNVKK